LQAKGRPSRPAKVAPQDSRDAISAAVRNLSGIPPGASLPFAGMARSHKAGSHNALPQKRGGKSRPTGSLSKAA